MLYPLLPHTACPRCYRPQFSRRRYPLLPRLLCRLSTTAQLARHQCLCRARLLLLALLFMFRNYYAPSSRNSRFLRQRLHLSRHRLSPPRSESHAHSHARTHSLFTRHCQLYINPPHSFGTKQSLLVPHLLQTVSDFPNFAPAARPLCGLSNNADDSNVYLKQNLTAASQEIRPCVTILSLTTTPRTFGHLIHTKYSLHSLTFHLTHPTSTSVSCSTNPPLLVFTLQT